MTEKETLFRLLYESKVARNKYSDSIPYDLSGVFLNEYTDSLHSDYSALLKAFFGSHTQSIEWFLYEWKSGYEVGIDGVNTKIHNIDEYVSFLKTFENFGVE
jgi:protein tyrosine phosphatase